MLQIADRVGQLNERGLLRGDKQISRLFDRFRFLRWACWWLRCWVVVRWLLIPAS